MRTPISTRKAAKKKPAKKHALPRVGAGDLEIRPLTPRLMDDLKQVLSGGWGSGCWCMFPRLTAAEERALPGPGGASERRRLAMAELARRRRAPGLLAYLDGEVVGWVAVAPRGELSRVDKSRATPRVDEVDVWVVPCITVRKKARGRGVALALIEAAVDYAARYGAPAVEAYARAGGGRVHDDLAFFGTEPLFRRAGFRVIREHLRGMPKTWTPRVTMRRECELPSSPD
jgi:GNAT superfamily N-acetyltransferase